METNTLNLTDLWSRGDAVSHAVAVILLVMSVLSWAMIAYGAWRHFKLRGFAKDAEGFWTREDIGSAIAALKDGSPWKAAASGAKDASQSYDASEERPCANDKADWIARVTDEILSEVSSQLSRGMPLLASIGATAPFVGLFGTVWGIYHTLMTLSGGGQMTIDQVAGPIGEALVMTAFGLFVAIPAVLGNNAIAASNRLWLEELSFFASRLGAHFAVSRAKKG